jgi:hypothetical protein
MIDVTRVYYELPNDLHRAAKTAATMEGHTLKDYLIEALTVAVEKTERERGVVLIPKTEPEGETE